MSSVLRYFSSVLFAPGSAQKPEEDDRRKQAAPEGRPAVAEPDFQPSASLLGAIEFNYQPDSWSTLHLASLFDNKKSDKQQYHTNC